MANAMPPISFDPFANVKLVAERFNAGRLAEAQEVFNLVWDAGYGAGVRDTQADTPTREADLVKFGERMNKCHPGYVRAYGDQFLQFAKMGWDAALAAPTREPALRERFEVWAKEEQCDLSRERGGSYTSTFTDLAWQAVAALAARPADPAEPTDLLVTMTISVARDGALQSDVQTHDNSYADVAVGLAAVKAEIERVFIERRDCPHYPKNADEAHRKILRATPAEPSVRPARKFVGPGELERTGYIPAGSADERERAAEPSVRAAMRELTDGEIDAIFEAQHEEYGQLCDRLDMRMFARACIAKAGE